MKYKVRISQKVYNSKIKGYREYYVITKSLSEEQVEAILKILQTDKIEQRHQDATDSEKPVSRGTSKGDNL
ncbi:MAG: hypothetical protein QXE05_08090 [Nitrososphaeria archaeon]